MDKIKIGIVDDQKLFRDGLAAIINSNDEFELLFTAESAHELYGFLETGNLPHVLLLDMSLPEVNGIEINEKVHREFSSVKTIILTAYDQVRFILRLIENGANSFLSKNCDVAELTQAIKSVHNSGFYFNKTISAALQSGFSQKKSSIININGIEVELTNRELEILILICKEYTTQEIAEKLFISIRTVDGHRLNLLDKVGCKNIAGLVIFAITNNIYLPLK